MPYQCERLVVALGNHQYGGAHSIRPAARLNCGHVVEPKELKVNQVVVCEECTETYRREQERENFQPMTVSRLKALLDDLPLDYVVVINDADEGNLLHIVSVEEKDDEGTIRVVISGDYMHRVDEW